MTDNDIESSAPETKDLPLTAGWQKWLGAAGLAVACGGAVADEPTNPRLALIYSFPEGACEADMTAGAVLEGLELFSDWGECIVPEGSDADAGSADCFWFGSIVSYEWGDGWTRYDVSDESGENMVSCFFGAK